MYGSESATEIWTILLIIFAGLLIVESWMTNRLVRQRHGESGISMASPNIAKQ